MPFARSVLTALAAVSVPLANPIAPLAAAGAPELHLQRLGTEDGLSHAAVQALAQDHEGFLWIGTAAGLDRFDGYQAVRFGGDLGAVAALLVDRRDRFWVGTGAGLFRLDRATGEVTRHQLEPQADPPRIHSLAEDGAGRIWVGAGARLHIVDGDEAREVPFERSADEDPRAAISGFSHLPDGGLLAWLVELSPPRTTLLYVDAAGDQARIQRPPPRWGRAGRGHVDRRGRIWLDPWHVASLDADGGLAFRRLAGGGEALAPSQACEDLSGRLWFAAVDGLYLRVDEQTPPRFVPPDPSRSNWQQGSLLTCLVDRGGGVWLGSLGGLFHWDPHRKPFRHLRHDPADPASLGADPVSSLVESADGRLWVGAYGGGLSLLDRASGRVRRYRHDRAKPSSLCDDRVWSLAAARDGGLWVGTESGLCRMFGEDAPSFERRAVPGLPAAEGDARIKAIAAQRDGILWLGTNFGLFRLDPVTGASRRLDAGDGGLENRQVGDLLLEEPDALWVASTDGDLQLLDLRSGRTAAATRLLRAARPVRGAVYDLARGPAARLWAGTHLGLARFDEDAQRFELVDLGGQLPSSIVYSVLAGSGESLWLGTGRGLARLTPGSGVLETFGLADGVGSLEFNRHAALRLADGSMAFGGMDGLTLFRPEDVRPDPRPPPVALTAVRVLGEDGERSLPAFGLAGVELTHRDHALTVEYAALGFSQPTRSRYAYRLEGSEASWVEAGEQRVARYTNLPAGNYVLRVRAANADGVWNEEGLALAVRVLPAYWETWWFRAALGLVAAGLLTLAYQLRLRHLLALQRMRLRIAGDLHDDLGSEVAGIALVASMLRGQAHLTPRDRERLAQVETTSRRVMQGLRDVVWTINPEHDTAGSLAERMRAAAELLLGDREREVAITVDDPEAPMAMDRRRNLLLAYKELLHNVSRHAGACSVKVRSELRGDGFALEVTDDGRGFDPEAARGGTGLASLRRRAERLGAELAIDSRPGAGTTVRMRSR